MLKSTSEAPPGVHALFLAARLIIFSLMLFWAQLDLNRGLELELFHRAVIYIIVSLLYQCSGCCFVKNMCLKKQNAVQLSPGKTRINMWQLRLRGTCWVRDVSADMQRRPRC